MSEFRGNYLSGSAAVVVLVGFFLPWIMVSCGGQPLGSISGYELAFGSVLGDGELIFALVPLAAIATLALIFAGMKFNQSERVVNGGQIAAALIAIAVLAYKWQEMRSDLDIANQNPFSGDIMGAGFSMSIEYGLWFTLIGLLLIIVGAAIEFLQSESEESLGYSAPSMQVASGPATQAVDSQAMSFDTGQSEVYTPIPDFNNSAPSAIVDDTPSDWASADPSPLDSPFDQAKVVSPKTEVLRQEPKVLAWLIVKDGPRAGHQFRLDEVTDIGRDASNDVILDDTSLSSKHARIKIEDGHFYLHDLASTNGTFVYSKVDEDWEQVYRHEIKDGDQVKFGRSVLHFMQLDTGSAETQEKSDQVS